MAENYKHLYLQAVNALAMYQDKIVPGLREQLAKRVEVVRCEQCNHYEWRQSLSTGKIESICKYPCGLKHPGKGKFCSYGERRDNE